MGSTIKFFRNFHLKEYNFLCKLPTFGDPLQISILNQVFEELDKHSFCKNYITKNS